MKVLVTFTKGVQIMTVKEKRRIKKQQKVLMQERDIFERMQTEHSDDTEAERLRRVLEVRCSE